MLYRLLSFEKIGLVDDALALMDESGGTILLGDRPGLESTTDRLRLLPWGGLLEKQVLLGGFYYDRQDRRLKFWPLSIVTEEGIVRLLY